MDHNFVPSQLNSSVCARCKYDETSHTSRATCEQCGSSGTCNVFTGMLLCMDCIANEKRAILENQSEEKQAERLRSHQALTEMAKRVDQSVTVKSDVYNAETIATIKVFQSIDSDESIQNKVFAKAQFLSERYEHFSKVVFEARSVLETATSSQRAIQSQLNELANQLREDERSKLQLNDLNYHPSVVKPKRSESRAQRVKKWTKASVREAAANYKVPVDAVQMICVARNLDAESAAKILHEQFFGADKGKVN